MKQTTTHIIYVPGLGDGYDTVRRTALKLWRRKNVSVEFVPMKWRNESESFAQKVSRVEKAITSSKADRIVLVGESAGGAMVTVLTQRHRQLVAKTITLFGKNQRADRVSPSIYLKNPAFKDTMLHADRIIKDLSDDHAKKYTHFYAKLDPVIWLADTHITGAKLRHVPLVGHVFSIFTVLFILSPMVIKEAKKS